MRKLFAAGMAVTALALMAGTAEAKPAKEPFTYTATIDCGRGPVVVGSTDDMFAPLFELRHPGRRYQPIAWDVMVDGREIVADNGAKRGKHAVDCSYDDGVATGTVTVEKA
jgi:hypothetical protein